MIATKKSGLVFLGIFLIGMLFIPPSIQPMIPEAAAVAVQDRGDFILTYDPTSNYASLAQKVKNWGYFENQIEWLNDTFKTPHDVNIVVAECGKYFPPDEAVNAYYVSRAVTGTDSSVILYCYELIEAQYDIMKYLVTPGQGDRIIPSHVICPPGKAVHLQMIVW